MGISTKIFPTLTSHISANTCISALVLVLMESLFNYLSIRTNINAQMYVFAEI